MKTQSNRKLLILLFGFALFMVGFGYAMVPLYNVFCRVTGINGKTGGKAPVYVGQVDKDRWVTVEFLSTVNAQLPWEFYPIGHRLRVHPGETNRFAFMAKNLTGRPMTVQAIPSVTPGYAARYLKKTECFCFTQQTLKGEEQIKFPLIFHLDPDLPKEVKTLTLSYTLFDVSKIGKPVGS